MEKNSAPRLPCLILPRSIWPSETGAFWPKSKFSSRNRCGVSACVSMMMADWWIAWAESGLGFVVLAEAVFADDGLVAFFCCETTGREQAMLKVRAKVAKDLSWFIHGQFYQPPCSPRAILYNDRKSLRGNGPGGVLLPLQSGSGHAYSSDTLPSTHAGRV